MKDRLVQSHYEPKKHDTKPKGLYQCHNCPQCEFILEGNHYILSNGDPHRVSHFINCHTTGVVYMMKCACGRFYVGKTKRKLNQRIYEHISDIVNGAITSPIAYHVAFAHKFDPSVVKFMVLDRVKENLRGGDLDKILLQKETKWIATLQAKKIPGLNDSLSYKPFL